MLRVADTGPGIPREKWDHIFDRFTQLSDPNVREIAGFGLGLNIVKKIVEAHGGVVWCDSEVGKGSEFYVSLPTKTATARTEIEPAIPPPARRVLVCDADPELAAAVAQTLRWKKFDVRVVHSGCSLLAQLEQGGADIVVTDVLLPDMNAADLLNALNTMPERSFRLVVHSYAGEAQELTRRYGVDVFLRRPVSREELLKAVNIAMNKRFSSGLSIVVVRSESLNMTPIITLLSDSGHTPMVTESVESAAAMTHDYATDVVLVPAGTLNNNWAELNTLRTDGNDERMRIIVLCDALRKKERRLAEEHGVLAVTYRPGQPEELKAAIRPSEETLLVESTQ
jgi:CheY-like chemotaxis protein